MFTNVAAESVYTEVPCILGFVMEKSYFFSSSSLNLSSFRRFLLEITLRHLRLLCSRQHKILFHLENVFHARASQNVMLKL